MRASEFTKQELDEKVNPRVVEPGFTAEKRLGNRYVMKAEARYTGEPGDDLRGLIIKVYDTKAKPTMLNWGIGMTRFVARQDPTTQDWYLVSSTTHVDDRYQRQGLASAMYNWARELGNDIEPSSNRTKMGKHFWEKGAGAGREFVDQPPETDAPPAIPTSTAAGPAKAQSLRDRLIKMFTEERVWEQDDSEVKSHDFMAGHCHVMAIALKQLHPDWQIRAHVGYDDDEADDTEYRVDHVYTVAPDGTAYDCRGRFDNEQQLVGPDTTGGVDTQYVNFGPEEIKQAMLRGELKRFTKQDLANAMQVATQAGKQDVSEAPAGYKEIEFVCVNPQFPDATDPALQKKMYRGLKQIDGVVPLWQEWGDYSEGQASLSAIYQGSKNRDKILSLAKQLGVEVDLEQAVSDDYVDRAMRGEHEGQQGLTERKQSPLEDFEGLQFRMVNDNGQLFVNAFDSTGGNELGHVTFDIGDGKELDPQNLYVKHKFRSQGIAQIMYDFVKSKGYKIQRSWDQTDAGAGFWDKHRGEERVWEQGVAEGAPELLKKEMPLHRHAEKLLAQNGVSKDDPDYHHHLGNTIKHLRQFGNIDLINKQGVAEGKQPGQPVVDAILKVMPIAQEIWFHGSRATRSHRKNSDTDILVIVPDDLVGDQYLGAVRILQKLSTHFDNHDIQPTKSGTNIHRIAQEEGRLLWSNKQAVAENFADGRNPQDKGDSKRHGINTKASVSSLRKTAKQGGRKGQLAHWLANMKSGRAKKK